MLYTYYYYYYYCYYHYYYSPGPRCGDCDKSHPPLCKGDQRRVVRLVAIAEVRASTTK